MAVSKRTRFEVLRRDNYTCRYCKSTDGPLTVDHVTPIALGGSDDPSNLVAACKDCNAGKASSSPDSATVAQVSDDAVRWAEAMRQAAAESATVRATHKDLLRRLYDYWGPFGDELPGDWDSTTLGYIDAGLSIGEVEDAIGIAIARIPAYSRSHFQYFCGVCRNKVAKLAERARQILDEESAADGA